jgi:hypothetical protein
MSTKMFIHKDTSRLAYVAEEMTAAGFEGEVQMARRRRIDFTSFFRLFRGDLPAALAYEAHQMASADDRRDTCLDEKGPSFFEKVTAWVTRKPVTQRLAQTASC